LEHAILFLFMGAAALRALLALRTAQWMVAVLYLVAMGVFFTIAAAFHYGAYYQITSLHVRVLNGMSKRCGRDIPIDQILTVDVRSELFNRWLGVGALVLTCAERTGDPIVLKGVPDPDRIKRQLDAVIGRKALPTADAAYPR
jgi:uncharacterized membrane protein YdbT with pleckstrin-like domain